jgi:hypothetical protein
VLGIAVSGEKDLQPDDVRSGRRPDQHDAAGASLKQGDPSNDERAHDPLAEVGLGDQQGPQPLRGNEQRLDIALGDAVDQRRAAG